MRADDSDLPIAEREVQRRRHQQRYPPVGAMREHQGATDDHGDTPAKCTPAPGTEVAVLPWRDQTLHAGSRGSGVVIRSRPTTPLTAKFREDARAVAELTSDDQLLTIAELLA
jgi:hypothetical protein